MSTIPTSLTEKQFEEHVRPFISVAKRGFECSIPLYKVFNYILYRLHTGCQWEQLPIEPDPEEEATPIVEVSDLTLADLQDGPIPSLGSRSTTPATPSSDATILYSMVEDEAEFPPNTVGQALVFV